MNGQLSRTSILALAIVALGLGLRLYRLDAQSFWYDEAFSVGVASGTASQIFMNDFCSVHPPLYYLTLHYWLGIGQGDFVVRLLSTMLAVAGIAAMYSLGRVLYEETAGLVAATITAVAPYMIFYSQEARMYTLLFLLSALLITSYARMLRRDSPGCWAAYTVLAALGVNTHYFSGLLILALHVHFVISRNPGRTPWRRLASSDGLIVLTLLPRLSTIVFQAGRVSGDYWISRPSLAQLLSAPHAWTLTRHVTESLVPLAFALVLFVFFVTHLQCARELASGGPDAAALTLMLLALWVPLLLTFVLSQWRPVYLERTLMVSVPGFYLLLSWGTTRTRERFFNLALALGIALFAVDGLWNWYFDPAFGKPPFRAAAQFLKEKAEPGEPILHTSDAGFLLFTHYAPGYANYLLEGDPAPAVPLEVYELFGGEIISKEEVYAPRFWLVAALDNSIDFQRGLVEWFDARHTLRESYTLDGIYLRHYDARHDAPE